MAPLITRAGAWCNGDVAYLAWQIAKPIDGCLGFMITRVHETGIDAGVRRILPAWIAFNDQSNPNWQVQDTSIWPVQSFEWRDLTLRKSRDTAKVRPIDFRVHYEIVPVGLEAQGRPPVPTSDTAVYLDPAGQPRYSGSPRPLFLIGEPARTAPIDVTHTYAGPKAELQATFNNGIISTQNMLQQLRSVRPQKPGDPPDTTTGLLDELRDQIRAPNGPIRAFLTGDALAFVRKLLDRAKTEHGEVFLALYELDDPELIPLLADALSHKRAHLILSTAGSDNPNPKNTPKEQRKPVVWDTTNNDARLKLQAIAGADLTDRMFNNSAHIGHDKFAVYVKDGRAVAVMTGSTNWTSTGLCTQSNNTILIEDETVAGAYLAFWNRLKADPQPPRVPLTVGKLTGAAASSGVQGKTLREKNTHPSGPTTLGGGAGDVTVWFSPNTKAATKTATSAAPPDLAAVYDLMDKAKQAIFFLTFMPGTAGDQTVVGEADRLAKARPDLLVMGAASQANALPGYQPSPKGSPHVPAESVYWPGGDRSRIAFIRATAIATPVGDLRPELLSAGHAIIHDKIIVIDPLDPKGCTVITGSHNLGYKASYANDENLLIIRGNQALAVAYAIHVVDVYDHYLMRAKIEQTARERTLAGKPAPRPSTGHGFLKTDGSWQNRFFPVPPASSLSYFLSAAAPAKAAATNR